MDKMDVFNNNVFTEEFTERVNNLPVEISKVNDILVYQGRPNSGKTTKMIFDIVNKLEEDSMLYCLYMSDNTLHFIYDILRNNVTDIKCMYSISRRFIVCTEESELISRLPASGKIILAEDFIRLADDTFKIIEDRVIARYRI